MAVRTKQAIRQAFIELLNERPLDKISVKDIAERSTVNRNTFYYYYADIYALVEEIFQTETQLFMEKLHSYASWEEAFREATAFVSENKRAVHHLFNSGNRNILGHYYQQVTYAAMLSYVRGQAESLSAAEEDIQALAQFYAAELSGMTADWLRGGMKSNVNDHIDRLGRSLRRTSGQALGAAAADTKKEADPGGGGPPYVLLCACGSGQGVFGGVALKLAAEGVRIAVRRAKRFVQIEIVLRGVDDAAGDVGAVVGGALEVREQIGPDEAGFDAAMPLLHPQDVARAHLLLERVDDLLERLDQLGEGDVLPLERAHSERSRISPMAAASTSYSRAVMAWRHERLAAQLLGGFENVHGVVGNALKVPDGLQSSVASSLSSTPILRALR